MCTTLVFLLVVRIDIVFTSTNVYTPQIGFDSFHCHLSIASMADRNRLTIRPCHLSSVSHPLPCASERPLCGNGDFDLNTGLDVDDDLLDNFSGSVEVDEA
jgi:hypothetical protein